MNMNWGKAIGFGVGLWVLMFVIISALIGFNLYQGTAVHVVMAVVGGIISYIFAGYVKPADTKQALMCGAAWIFVSAILDAVITMRFNQAIFASRALWLGYALVLFAPLFRAQMKKPVEKPVV
jgi:hypothetical protein